MNRIQEIELGILKEIDRVCKEHDITYQVIGGSLLGAVRHKGFIPWDDDIDIGMLRSDYDRFLKLAEKEIMDPYALQTYDNTASHHYYFSHIVDSRYSVRRLGSMDQRVEKVWVDIYPLDGLPNNKIIREMHYAKLTAFNFLYHVGYFEKVNIARPDRALYQKILISAIKPIYKLVRFDGPKWRDRMDKCLKRYNPEGSKYVLNFIGPKGKKEIFNRDVFYELEQYEFEDLRVLGSKHYDLYLSQIYGDWRVPPKDGEKDCHPMELLF